MTHLSGYSKNFRFAEFKKKIMCVHGTRAFHDVLILLILQCKFQVFVLMVSSPVECRPLAIWYWSADPRMSRPQFKNFGLIGLAHPMAKCPSDCLIGWHREASSGNDRKSQSDGVCPRTRRWARRRANQLWRISLALPPRVARSRGAPPARHRGGDAPHSWCPRLVVIFAKGPRCRSRVSFERPWRDASKGPAREGPSPTTAQCSAACVSDSVCNGSLASDATYTWWPRTDSYHTSSAKSGICPFRIYDVSQ